MIRKTTLIVFSALLATKAIGQTTTTTLSADGPGETYELINSVLIDPTINTSSLAYEVPDCGHEEFGRHIDEAFDEILQKNVFQFYSHVEEDNDRCRKFDRARTEIKAYDKSAPEQLATEGETHTYTWSFFINEGFLVTTSFTHLFQLKASGGDDSAPVLTLTTKRNSGRDEAYLAQQDNSDVPVQKLDPVPLETIVGKWVNARCTVLNSDQGSVTFSLTDLDGNLLYEYADDNVDLWRTGADFNRPKWGIYRSTTKTPLRDEIVKFADFTITEGAELPNEAPTVSINDLDPNTPLVAGNSVSITANASDTDGSIEAVTFYANDNAIGTDTEAPYEVAYTLVDGANTIYAVAVDDDSATTTSAIKTITATTPVKIKVLPLKVRAVNVNQGYKIATVIIRLQDEKGAPVSGATVRGKFSGFYNEEVSGTTHEEGYVVLSTTYLKRGRGLVKFCINNIQGEGVVYDYNDSNHLCSVGLRQSAEQEEKPQLKSRKAFGAYPNPARGTLHITGFETVAKLYDLQGRIVRTFTQAENTIENLKEGVYVLRQGNRSARVIINNE